MKGNLHTCRWIVLVALLALALAVALCACSGGQEPSKEVDTPVETATPTPTPTATPEPTPTSTPAPTPKPKATPKPEPTVQPVTSTPDKGNGSNQQGNGSSDNGPREATEEEIRAMGLGGEPECNVDLAPGMSKEEVMQMAEDYWKAREKAGCR